MSHDPHCLLIFEIHEVSAKDQLPEDLLKQTHLIHIYYSILLDQIILRSQSLLKEIPLTMEFEILNIMISL